ncbi:MAG: exosome complex RNA-binding protein Csl4 [Candidatus Micrarchaeia archaeon]
MAIAIPGEALAAEEEGIPSAGTYLEDGTIYSMLTGLPNIANMKVSIAKKLSDVATFNAGMYILGEIVDNLRTVLFVKISDYRQGSTKYVALKSGKIVAPKGRALVHFNVGDIILAYIYRNEKDNYILELRDPELGVVYSSCPLCNAFMKKVDQSALKCGECGYVDTTKVSSLYGDAKAIEAFLDKSNSGGNGGFYNRRHR